ncbi:MAG: molybdate transporter family protein [Gammaproteobacteria bacterium]
MADAFGALPMCHGAGGLQAQYRFGARSGVAPAILGSILAMGLFFADSAAALLACVPVAAAGALLLLPGLIWRCRSVCSMHNLLRPVIILTAASAADQSGACTGSGLAGKIVQGLLVRAVRRRY